MLLTIIAAVGIYYGAAVFGVLPDNYAPMTHTMHDAATMTTVTTTTTFTFALPVGMPSLQDLKMPYTSLPANGLAYGIAGIVLSALAFAVQCFLRGAYLGSLRLLVMSGQEGSLLGCGKYFVGRMVGWSIFQLVAGLVVAGIGALFIPLAIVGMIVLLMLGLTPYLIVLADKGVTECVQAAPGLFRRSFGRLFLLALAAMIFTFLCSFLKELPQPAGYLVPLFVYIPIATLFIRELLARLSSQMREEGALLPMLPKSLLLQPDRRRPLHGGLAIAGIVLLPLLGAAASSGQLAAVVPEGPKTEWRGTGFLNGFSNAFYNSNFLYASYDWMEPGADSIKLRLPGSVGAGNGPATLSGTAEVSWTVMEERRETYGTSTHIRMEEARRTDRLFYRLVRETTETGATYYSSRSGTAYLLTSGGALREPHLVDMMVSGDGRHAFVMLYPQRFAASPVWRVSEDGRYLIPATSQFNPDDFRYFWFSAEPKVDDVFELIRAKNRAAFVFAGDQPHRVLPAALQEADGQRVHELLEMIRRIVDDPDVNVTAPDWDARTWTSVLRGRYEGASEVAVFDYLSLAAGQEGHTMTELTPSEEGAYRQSVTVRLPGGRIVVEYEEKDGRLRELIVRIL